MNWAELITLWMVGFLVGHKLTELGWAWFKYKHGEDEGFVRNLKDKLLQLLEKNAELEAENAEFEAENHRLVGENHDLRVELAAHEVMPD